MSAIEPPLDVVVDPAPVLRRRLIKTVTQAESYVSAVPEAELAALVSADPHGDLSNVALSLERTLSRLRAAGAGRAVA